MSKFFFLGFVQTHPEDEVRVSRSADYGVCGGSKERHEKAVAIVDQVSRECKKDPPQTQGEMRMIVAEAVKKIG